MREKEDVQTEVQDTWVRERAKTGDKAREKPEIWRKKFGDWERNLGVREREFGVRAVTKRLTFIHGSISAEIKITAAEI